jgi:hypothetical protein
MAHSTLVLYIEEVDSKDSSRIDTRLFIYFNVIKRTYELHGCRDFESCYPYHFSVKKRKDIMSFLYDALNKGRAKLCLSLYNMYAFHDSAFIFEDFERIAVKSNEIVGYDQHTYREKALLTMLGYLKTIMPPDVSNSRKTK